MKIQTYFCFIDAALRLEITGTFRFINVKFLKDNRHLYIKPHGVASCEQQTFNTFLCYEILIVFN